MASSTVQSNQNGTNHIGARPRSGTATSVEAAKVAPPSSAKSPRPTHLRSRSYLSGLSPTDPKPRNAVTLPSEGSPPMHDRGTENKDVSNLAQRDSESHIIPRVHKLHFPGHKSRQSQDMMQNGKDGAAPHQRSHMHMLSRANSHRHTKSDIPPRWSTITNTGSDVNIPARNHSQTHLAPSDIPLQHPAVAAAKGGMLTRISTNLSGMNIGGAQHKPRHQYSASDFHKGRVPASGAAFTGASSRPDVRRRATSDTRSPFEQAMMNGVGVKYGIANYIDGTIPTLQQQKAPLTELELLLLRAEKMRRTEEANTTEADVQKLAIQLAESRVDLQEQLASNTRTAASLIRRLDDAHDMLISTASSMIDTISSFQNLCQQSEALITNFEHRTNELDKSGRKTIAKNRKALFDERGAKITVLEERGRKASQKAEEVSRRLENYRTIIRNFTQREQTKRRAWRGVMMGTLTGFTIIVLGLLLGFGLWWYKNYGGDGGGHYDVREVIAGALDQNVAGGQTGDLNEVVKDRIREQLRDEAMRRGNVLDKVPLEVKAVLEDIARRHNSTVPFEVVAEGDAVTKSEEYTVPKTTGDIDEDKKLKKLFDKLEL